MGALSLLANTEFSVYLDENDKTVQDVLVSWFIRTPPISIESEVGAEERMLKIKRLLEQHDWQEADAETLNLLHWLVRTDEPFSIDEPFSSTALAELPCRDLKTIDGLWTYYSKGRFGYSIQESIFEEVGKDLFRFGEQVGWRNSIEWTFSNDYDLRAREGHLPSPVILTEPPRLQRTQPQGLSRTQPQGLQRTEPQGLSRTQPQGAENLLEPPQSLNRKPLAAIVPIPKSCEIK